MDTASFTFSADGSAVTQALADILTALNRTTKGFTAGAASAGAMAFLHGRG